MASVTGTLDRRVWFVSRTLPTLDDPVKGVFVIDQTEVVATFARVEVLNLRPITFRGRRGPLAVNPAINLRFVALPSRFGHLVCEASRLLARMIRRGRPILIHGHWSSGLGGVALAARIARIPLVVTEHGGPFPSRSPQVEKDRKILNMAKIVVSVSDWLRGELVDQGVEAPIIVIPNVIGSLFRPSPMPISEVVQIVAVARLDGFDKGIPEIINAVAQLKEEGLAVSLTIIGDGVDRPRLEAIASNAASPVVFKGILERSQVASVLSESRVFVSGTRGYETFGVAVAEALAAGRPVVATEVGAISELVIPGINGVLVTDTDARLIADGIRSAIGKTWDPDVISDSVAHCRFNQVAQDLQTLYASLALF